MSPKESPNSLQSDEDDETANDAFLAQVLEDEDDDDVALITSNPSFKMDDEEWDELVSLDNNEVAPRKRRTRSSKPSTKIQPISVDD